LGDELFDLFKMKLIFRRPSIVCGVVIVENNVGSNQFIYCGDVISGTTAHQSHVSFGARFRLPCECLAMSLFIGKQAGSLNVRMSPFRLSKTPVGLTKQC
jgi:hypothetical protein